MYHFFANNYMWSQAIMRSLSTGGAIGEVVKVVDALQEAAPRYDGEAWYAVWHGLGDFSQSARPPDHRHGRAEQPGHDNSPAAPPAGGRRGCRGQRGCGSMLR